MVVETDKEAGVGLHHKQTAFSDGTRMQHFQGA